MAYNKLFLNEDMIPQPFDDKTQLDYFISFKNGNLEARRKLVEHNIRLVLKHVSLRFANTSFDQEELVSVGIFGLIKAVNNFDISKNSKFENFAITCIHNEILGFINREKKHFQTESLYEHSFARKFEVERQGEEQRYYTIDNIKDDTYAMENIIIQEIIANEIRKTISNLNEKERYTIIKRFGFDDDVLFTEKQIAQEIGFSQSYVSRFVKKTIRKVATELLDNDIIEPTSKVLQMVL